MRISTIWTLRTAGLPAFQLLDNDLHTDRNRAPCLPFLFRSGLMVAYYVWNLTLFKPKLHKPAAKKL